MTAVDLAPASEQQQWHVPPKRFPRALPIATGVAGLVATGYTAAVDPNTSHAFPLCPLRAVTGLDCPLCGGLRGVHSLIHGDLIGALDHNVLLVAILPLALVAYGLWLGRSLGWSVPTIRVSPRVVAVTIGLLVVFGVVRNLPIPGHDLLNSTAMLAGRPG